MTSSIVAFKDQQRSGHSFVSKTPSFSDCEGPLIPRVGHCPRGHDHQSSSGTTVTDFARVAWTLPYYWLVLYANGRYWLASPNLRATLHHVTPVPPPYIRGTHSFLPSGSLWSIFFRISERSWWCKHLLQLQASLWLTSTPTINTIFSKVCNNVI
jgi:hypothetical protein